MGHATRLRWRHGRIAAACVATVGGLLWVGVARAQDAPAVDVELHAMVKDVAVVRGEGGSQLVAVGATRTWVLDAGDGSVTETWDHGGDAVLAGSDGTVWTCSARGLVRSVRGEGSFVHDPPVGAACRAIAALPAREGEQARLLIAGSDLRIRSIPVEGEPTERSLELPEEGWPVLAVDGKRFAVVMEGGAELLEEGPWGTSSLSTGGKVGGLAAGPSSWIWSLPADDVLVDVTRRRLMVAPGPGALADGDVDGDGLRDILVAHPDHPVMGLVRGGSREEQALTAPTGIHRLVVANLDDDECDEVIVLTATGRLQVRGQPCGDARPRAVTVDEPTPGPDASQSDATADEPVVTTTETRKPLVVAAETRPEIHVEVGQRLDLQLVDAVGTASAFAASGGPSALVVTSSGTVLYRARPGDVGRWKVSVRLWEDGSWSRRAGFDLVVDGAEVTTVGGTRVSRTTTDLSLALDEDVGRLERRLPVRGCLFGMGGVLGGSKGRSWVTLGDGFLLSGSPALAFTCDGGATPESPFWWFAGLDLAPFFVYLHDEQEFRHGLSATVGAGWQEKTLYAGVYVTAGATVLGGGPVVRWLPLRVQSGRRQGIETRVTLMPTKELVFEGMLLYTMQLGAYARGPAEDDP